MLHLQRLAENPGSASRSATFPVFLKGESHSVPPAFLESTQCDTDGAFQDRQLLAGPWHSHVIRSNLVTYTHRFPGLAGHKTDPIIQATNPAFFGSLWTPLPWFGACGPHLLGKSHQSSVRRNPRNPKPSACLLAPEPARGVAASLYDS